MKQAAPSHPDLHRPLPENGSERLALFAARRMAIHGLKDAHAASALLTGFGKSYRRPLVLMRAMMLELARASQRTIMLAPCCCPRMTDDEAHLMEALRHATRGDVQGCHNALKRLLAAETALGPLTCAQAVGHAFADLGKPLAALA